MHLRARSRVATEQTKSASVVPGIENSRISIGEGFPPPAGIVLALGSAHFRNGARAEAERCWTETVTYYPTLGEAWNNLAVIHMGAGRKQDAEDAIRNAERAGFRVNPRLKEDIRRMPGGEGSD